MNKKELLIEKAEALTQRLFDYPAMSSLDLCNLLELINIFKQEESDRIEVKTPEHYHKSEENTEKLKELQSYHVVNLNDFKKESKKYWKALLNNIECQPV